LCVLFKIGVLLLKVLSIINKYGLHLAWTNNLFIKFNKNLIVALICGHWL
jgi:hypothetical protein